jgi:acetate kinase
MKILVLNSGSSSQKCVLYEVQPPLGIEPPARLWDGKIDWSDAGVAEIAITAGSGPTQKETIQLPTRQEAIERLLKSLWNGPTAAVSEPAAVDCVGHRVVHGGPHHLEPTFVDSSVRNAIAGVSAFAPLHNRAELEGITIVEKLLGNVPQVAVFDTGFHRHMPRAAKVYPGPYEWYTQGIHRYGFHGINHQYCSERVAHLLGRDVKSLRIVNCHIGNGCSLAAIRDGHSIDTTMGFTPLEGLMMGTRSGSVDPGILTYLMRSKSMTGEQLDDLLNKRSGLLGLSGISSDVRDIQLAAESNHERAKLAWEVYEHRLAAGIGSMVAALGGIDTLSFTAGVGENSVDLRSKVGEQFSFLGLELDPHQNGEVRGDRVISSSSSKVSVLVIGAQEEWQIARECYRLSVGASPA